MSKVKMLVSPKGREYSYRESAKGIATIGYLGQEIKVEIRNYKAMPIDQILKEVELEMFLDGDIPDNVVEEQVDMLLEQDWDERDSISY
jgi:hypothetical protein